MKSHIKIFIFSFALMAFFSSCEEDGVVGPGPIVEDEITLDLSTDAGFVSVGAIVEPGETFAVRMVAKKGTDDLQAITIQENGVSLDISRFTATNSSVGGNPFTLGTDEASSFTKDIEIIAPTTSGDYTYTFIITDFGNNTDSESITITVNATPPTVSFMGSGMVMAELGSFVSIRVMATAGSSPLDQIAVYNGNDLVSETFLFYGDINNAFPSNPGLIPIADRQMLNREIIIEANEIGLNVYTVEITDEAGLKSSIDYEITTGTEVTSLMGVLLNQAGISGTGGLDLDTGNSVGSNDSTADIKDEGIDLSQPLADNWLQQISGANGAEMRSLIAGENGLSESYSFDNIATKEQIEGIWGNGAPLTVTSKINGGENFVVLNNGNYYLIKINEVRITQADNLDQYLIDIKL